MSLEQARNLSAIFHEKDKKVVGVFVDENLEQILRCIKEAKLDGIQIYRTITKEEFEILKVQNVFVWQVISVENSLDLKSEIFANLVLFDAKGILKGGNGISFDWTLLGSYTKDFALAGGIDLDNIHKAVQTGAKILDLNSKLEDEKGLKDINKIKQILKELKK